MRIVIVEDEAPIREGIARILGKISPEYELVGTAADGESGYELVCRTEPDLVIMDIRMPKMDGLTMMKKLRQEQAQCKVIVLSAYSDFSYAQQAIRLGIANYLLKPINLADLRNALQQVEEMCRKEQQAEKVFSLNNIFLGVMNRQISPDADFHAMMKEKYGFTIDEPAQIFMLWLGKTYEERKAQARRLLESVAAHTVRFEAYIQELEHWNMILMIIFRQQEPESMLKYFQNSIMTMMVDSLGSPVLGGWREVEKISDIGKILPEFKSDMQWGLLFDEKTLICREEIDKLARIPLKYPLGMEDDATIAVRCGNTQKIVRCYEQLYDYCMQAPREPSELKKCLIRFNWALVQASGSRNREMLPEFQHILQGISAAVTWAEIEENMHAFFSTMQMEVSNDSTQSGGQNVSAMVQKAQEMIAKYYDQGVTLEEIARKLFVSEEYLSAQFKKETGVTFSETVRKYRVAKVRRLLLETHLKLNQIAELAGYSDPKYMSKVFKEEMGMLPSEYRKSVH